MKHPRPARQANASGYPTLREFTHGRREFLRRMALGAMAVGVIGPLSACLDHHVEEADPDASPGPDGDGPPPDAWTRPEGDASPDGTDGVDTYTPEPTEPPFAGGMPEPEYFDVRLPAGGFAQAYLQLGGYVSFAVRYVTWESGVFGQFVADPDGELAVVSGVLALHTCEELAAADLTSIHDELRAALEQYLSDALGYGGLEAVTLEVEYCDPLGPIDGDMPEPSYP